MSKPKLTGMKVNPDEIEFESMIFYITWFEQLEKLRGTMGDIVFIRGIEQLCKYAFHGEVPDNSDNPVLEMFFNMARASIDANIKLRIAGKRGNETMRNKATEKNKSETPKPRGRKKKEEPKPEEEPVVPRFEVADDEWLDPTPENIARMKAQG